MSGWQRNLFPVRKIYGTFVQVFLVFMSFMFKSFFGHTESSNQGIIGKLEITTKISENIFSITKILIISEYTKIARKGR